MCLRKKTQLVETEDCCWLMGLPPSQLPLHLSSFHVLCSLNEQTGSALSEVKCEFFFRSVYPLKGGENLHCLISYLCVTRLTKKRQLSLFLQYEQQTFLFFYTCSSFQWEKELLRAAAIFANSSENFSFKFSCSNEPCSASFCTVSKLVVCVVC